MKTEKLVWVMFILIIALAFGVMVFTAPAMQNKILAGFMCLAFSSVLIITIKD